jgi:hypothetical protein
MKNKAWIEGDSEVVVVLAIIYGGCKETRGAMYGPSAPLS